MSEEMVTVPKAYVEGLKKRVEELEEELQRQDKICVHGNIVCGPCLQCDADSILITKGGVKAVSRAFEQMKLVNELMQKGQTYHLKMNAINRAIDLLEPIITALQQLQEAKSG